jgi:putative ABC transport system substrate-binding protein
MRVFKGALILAVLISLSGYSYAKDIVVSVVLSSNAEVYKEVEKGFNSILSEKGIAARLNEHNLAGQEEKAVADAIAAENPSIVLAVGEAGLKAAAQQASGVPIVFSLIYSLGAYTNPNTSGVLLEIPIEMKINGIKKAFPDVKTIGMLYSPGSAAIYADTLAECEKQGLKLNSKQVNSETEFSDALNSILSSSDCFLVTADPKIYFSQTVKLLLLESLKRKIPVIGLSSFFTKAGAAMSFDSDYKDIGRQAGEIAARIIAGAKASSIKPVAPRKCVYSINLATAARLGIVFPQNVVKDAAEVFN